MKSRYHKPKPALFRCRSGFTLIEVIATLVLSAILIALLLPLIGSGLEGSRRALLRMPETYSLRTEMDAMSHLYRTVHPTDLPALSTAIATAAAVDPPPSYSLLYNDWVDFDAAGVEFIPAEGIENVLRVTLGNSQGERLTSYFFPIP
ncbi:MAG: prepilin-type N-terminal cleavage/methylation domain-containing protein [Luteolibacter sp.]